LHLFPLSLHDALPISPHIRFFFGHRDLPSMHIVSSLLSAVSTLLRRIGIRRAFSQCRIESAIELSAKFPRWRWLMNSVRVLALKAVLLGTMAAPFLVLPALGQQEVDPTNYPLPEATKTV